MLKQRIFTALVLIPLFVWAIFGLSSGQLGLILGGVVLLGAWEWSKFFSWTPVFRAVFFALFVISLVVGYWIATSQVGLLGVLVIAIGWWIIGWLWVRHTQRHHIEESSEPLNTSASNASPHDNLRSAIIGFLVLVPSYIALLALHSGAQFGPSFMLFSLTLMWVADSTAYFAGRKWGRHKLAKWVSPGKSWEGAAGALVVSAFWAFLGGLVLGLEAIQILLFIPLCVVSVMFSVVGDLFESMFKRRAQVKDSGSILPGHGGVLDRIDSITAGVPIFTFGLILLS